MNPNILRCFEKHSFAELNNIDVPMFEKVLAHFKKQFPTEAKVIFDVGCNAGSFIKTLLDLGFKSNIHCFEPHPILSKKVKDKYPTVIMNECCLSHTNSDIVINIPMWSCGVSSVIYRPVFNTLQGQDIIKYNTKAITIDSYCEQNNIEMIDFIKIDVEGAEKMVLDGAKRMLSQNKIRAGIFEYGATLTDAGTSAEEIMEMLGSYGYKFDKSLSKSDIYFYCEPKVPIQLSNLSDITSLMWIEEQQKQHREAIFHLEKLKQLLQKKSEPNSTITLNLTPELHWGC